MEEEFIGDRVIVETSLVKENGVAEATVVDREILKSVADSVEFLEGSFVFLLAALRTILFTRTTPLHMLVESEDGAQESCELNGAIELLWKESVPLRRTIA